MIIEGDAKKLAIIKARFRSFGLKFTSISTNAEESESTPKADSDKPKAEGKKRGPKPKQK